LQVDVVGDEALAHSSAVSDVPRPSDGFVDAAHDECDVIQPNNVHGTVLSVSLFSFVD
jgi:hypothetical protein